VATWVNWKTAEQRLLEAARQVFEAYAESATKAIRRASESHNIESPTIEPRTWIQLLADDKKEIIVRFVAPTRARGRLEQAIMRAYLSEDPRPAEPAGAMSRTEVQGPEPAIGPTETG